MDDLISRRALLELYADQDGIDFSAYNAPIPVVRQNILDMPAIAAEPAQWISINDKLPERGEDVLMLFETGIVTGGFICDSDTWCAYSDGEYYTDCSNNPTHWMPLPEPPGGDQEER